jgi:hypothetical protein
VCVEEERGRERRKERRKRDVHSVRKRIRLTDRQKDTEADSHTVTQTQRYYDRERKEITEREINGR